MRTVFATKRKGVGRFWLQIQSYELENPKYCKSGLREEDQVRDYENEEVCYQVYVGGI